MVSIQQLRKPKLFGFAIFDMVTALIGTVALFLIAKYYHFPNLDNGPFVRAGVILFIPIGIAVHILVGTNTALNYRLGLSNRPSLN